MSVIEVSHLTKDYGYGRGVFDVSAHVDEGECYGFLGPNGAGKSTTIRHLMGFSKPQSGTTVIDGRNSWKYAAELQRMVGYLPGEIAFPTGMSGAQFLKMQMQMRGLSDDTYLQKLLKKFELDPHIGLKQMSLGTRRKPVSYTHLDVYKRQIPEGARVFKAQPQSVSLQVILIWDWR